MKQKLKILALATLATIYSCNHSYYYENKENITIQAKLTTGIILGDKSLIHKDSIITTYNPKSGVKLILINNYNDPEKDFGVESIGVSYNHKAYDYMYLKPNTKLSDAVNNTWYELSNKLKNIEPEKRIQIIK